MQQYTKHSREGGLAAKKTHSNEKQWVIPLIFKCAFMILSIFIAFTLRVHLNDETERLNLHSVQIRARLHEKSMEIQNLKNVRAQLSSWPCISRKIEQYKLALHPVPRHRIQYLKRDASEQIFPAPRAVAYAQKNDLSARPAQASIRY